MGTPDDIEVRVAASLGRLPIVRALTETVALHSELTLDEVADLRLAVDEACSALIPAAVPESPLTCRFTIDKTEARVRITTQPRTAGLPDEDSFGWHVLRTLTSSLASSQHTVDGTNLTVIEFARTRTTTTPEPR